MTPIHQSLIEHLGEDFTPAYRQTKIILLHFAWEKFLEKIPKTESHLYVIKTQFLLKNLEALEKNNEKTLCNLHEFCNAKEQSELEPSVLLNKLKQQHQAQLMRIALAEKEFASESIFSQICHSFYYVKIINLILNAGEELAKPDLSPEVMTIIKNMTAATLTLLLIYSGNPLTTSYLGIQALTKVLFDDVDQFKSIAQRFAWDEMTMLEYLPWAKNISRYGILVAVTCAISGPGSIPAASLLHALYEGLQFLHEKTTTPYFEKLNQDFPDDTHVLQLIHFSVIFASSMAAGKVIDQIYPAEETESPCDINQAYETLGLSPQATSQEVLHSWRTAAKQDHPDRHGDKEVFMGKTTAFECLSKAGLVHRKR